MFGYGYATNLEVNNEDEGVVFFDLLHGGLGRKGVHDRAELVHSGRMGDGFTGVARLRSPIRSTH